MLSYPIPTKWNQLYVPPLADSVVCHSGGVESTALCVWLRSHGVNVHSFHVEYNQKSLAGERASVEYWSKKHKFDYTLFPCDMSRLAPSAIVMGNPVNEKNEVWHNVLEGRNLVFLSLATMYASGINSQHIYIGYNEEPFDRPYPDSTIESWKLFQALIDVSIRTPIRIHAPFAGMRRLDIMRGARALDNEIGIKTFSCFEGAELHCGVCEHCLKQKAMLEELGVEGWPENYYEEGA